MIAGEATEDTLTITGSVSSTDTDDGSSASYSIENTAGSYGSISIDSTTGDWLYTLLDSAVTVLDVGDSETDTFNVTVTDDQSATDTQTLSLTITGVNDAPIILGDFSGSANENEASVTGTIGSSDTDASSSANYAIENTTGTYGSIQIDSATGDWTYTLLDSAATTLDQGEVQSDEFNVTVSDDQGATDSATIDVTLTGVNDAPVISGDFAGEATEDTLTITGSVSSTDTDDGSTASYSIANTVGSYGSISIDSTTGDWTYTLLDSAVTVLDVGDSETDTFNVTVTDDQSATDTQTLSLTITGVNDAPIILGDFSGSANENEASVTGTIGSSDTDASSSVSYAIENTTGTYGSIQINSATGDWTYTLLESAAPLWIKVKFKAMNLM